jgi:hypothetical protein
VLNRIQIGRLGRRIDEVHVLKLFHVIFNDTGCMPGMFVQHKHKSTAVVLMKDGWKSIGKVFILATSFGIIFQSLVFKDVCLIAAILEIYTRFSTSFIPFWGIVFSSRET